MQLQIFNSAQAQTMSSREIAELTGKRHGDVIRDIRDMLSKIDDADLRHEQYQELKDGRGSTHSIRTQIFISVQQKYS